MKPNNKQPYTPGNRVVVSAPAKINLSLDVVGLDDRGYHLLDMVMQSVSVWETATLTKKSEGITLASNARFIPTDGKNVAVKAAQKFFEYTGKEGGVDIYIKKTVPIKAGMAGGSADAAAVIVGLDKLYGTELTLVQLCEIGAQAGSDVPFMIVGGTKRVQGVGDIILPCAPMPACYLVICMPERGVSTPEAFANYDRLGHKTLVETDKLIAAMEANDINGTAQYIANDLEEAAQSPDTQPVKEKLMSLGALGSVMTGSGAAVFGIFDDKRLADSAFEEMKRTMRSVFLAHPVNHGARVIQRKPNSKGRHKNYRKD